MDKWDKQQSLKQSLIAREQQLQSVAQSFADPILIIDRSGKYLDVIGGQERTFYYSGKFFIGKYVHDILPENLSDDFMLAISESIADNSLKTFEYLLDPRDIAGLPLDGPKQKQWFEARIYPLQDQEKEINSVICIPVNITGRKTLEEQVKNLSERDSLTGAYNKKYFLKIFNREFSITRRYKNRLSILHFDIDNIKEINERYGHDGGDVVLKRFVIFCEETFRDSDLFARYSTETFIVMLPNTPSLGAAIIAERIRGNTEEFQITYGQETIQFTVSVGISQFQDNDKNSNALLTRAASALYLAKKKGRNRIEII